MSQTTLTLFLVFSVSVSQEPLRGVFVFTCYERVPGEHKGFAGEDVRNGTLYKSCATRMSYNYYIAAKLAVDGREQFNAFPGRIKWMRLLRRAVNVSTQPLQFMRALQGAFH